MYAHIIIHTTHNNHYTCVHSNTRCLVALAGVRLSLKTEEREGCKLLHSYSFTLSFAFLHMHTLISSPSIKAREVHIRYHSGYHSGGSGSESPDITYPLLKSMLQKKMNVFTCSSPSVIVSCLSTSVDLS